MLCRRSTLHPLDSPPPRSAGERRPHRKDWHNLSRRWQLDRKCQRGGRTRRCKPLKTQIFDVPDESARALQLRASQEDALVRKAQGFALIDLIFVCGIIGLLASIALPRLMAAQQSAGPASAIGSMRAINSAQLTFALTCGSGFYAPDLPTLGTPPPGSREPFITSGLSTAASVNKAGYVIQMTASPFGGAPPSCNGVAPGSTG